MKKIRQPAVRVGIWLDREKAFLVRILGEGEPVMEKIKSIGETRSTYPGKKKLQASSADGDNEQQRQLLQLQHYLKEIIAQIRDADAIALFGPGKTKSELNKVLEADRLMKGKVVLIRSEDKITKSQVMALVKNYFSSESFLAKEEIFIKAKRSTK